METYEEKYKDLVKRLNKAREEKGVYTFNSVLDAVAPELKIDESKDEKTKRVLHSIANKMSQHLRDIFTEEEFQCFDAWSNAWLDKQGKQKHQYISRPKYIGEEELLGEQKPTEWSEEDGKHIHSIISTIECCKAQYKEAIAVIEQYDSDINWLKSLRPQSTWKPSDEHYELEEFAKVVRGNLTGISKAVQKLFEAKYLQLTGNKMHGGFKD